MASHNCFLSVAYFRGFLHLSSWVLGLVEQASPHHPVRLHPLKVLHSTQDMGSQDAKDVGLFCPDQPL